jgi:protein O-GlcNAc transferase
MTGSEELARLYAFAVDLQNAGRLEAAIDAYSRCLSLDPSLPEVHNNLGTALDRAGRLEEAVECFRHAHLLDPAYARPLVNLGRVLRLQGRPSEALASLERARALSPESPAALTNLGFVLTDLGRRAEAIQHLRRAIALEPGLAEAYHGLGRALLDAADATAALASLQRALSLKPTLLEARLPLAVSLLLLQRLPEALAELERMLEGRPDDPDVLAELLNCSLRMCDWGRVERALQRIRSAPGGIARATPFVLMGVCDDPKAHQEAARTRAQAITRDRIPLARAAMRARGKIRLAYVSGDFYTHATSFLIAELLELHDRSGFDVLGVSFGGDDESPLRRRVLGAFGECLDARAKSDVEVANWLREREVDIAVDLKGYTAYSRPGIFACRPAPVQVSYLGYPGTMAAPFIDYIVADSSVIPETEQPLYREKIAYLPDSYQANDRRRRVAERVPSRAEAGLPAEGFVFCCFNNNWKITAPVFDVWMRLLASVPGSVLWLLEDNRWAVESLRREAAARGVAPERLIFASRAANDIHLARHRLADLFLDTLPYNAHTTASDALWSGLPLVTCAGRSFASRVAASLLSAVGLCELVTRSLEEYAALALELARSPARLGALRARLTVQRDALPLFDTPGFCRHLEAAYRHMWLLHREGRAPETFAVERLQREAPRWRA